MADFRLDRIQNQCTSIRRVHEKIDVMILTLQVVGDQAQHLGAASRKTFKSIGGTIGRLADNDWVFADPYISGRHALIRYLNGKYFIEDTSTNGVFINSPDVRLKRAQPHQLRDGDRLYMDAYEIEVSIQQDPAAQAAKDPFADPHAPKAQGPKRGTEPPEAERTESLMSRSASGSDADSELEELDEIDEIDEFDEFDENNAANATQWYSAVEPPAPRSDPPAPARERRTAAAPQARPGLARGAAQPPAAVSDHKEQSHSAELAVLLRAAGIEGLEPTAEAARVLGEMLRIAVSGVMDALRARERMKDELRMRGTTFKAMNNNPLKFSANPEDAFHNLLVKRNPAYLPPAEAFDDAFRDVRDHQRASLLAMRLAFEALLAQFDPGKLQEEFDRQLKKGSILGVPAKLRYWDLYREKYDDMAKDADTSFRNLFGDEFARTYEEQLARMRSLEPKGNTD